MYEDMERKEGREEEQTSSGFSAKCGKKFWKLREMKGRMNTVITYCNSAAFSSYREIYFLRNHWFTISLK